MLEYLFDYGLFLAKAVTLVVAIGLVLGLIANSIRHARSMSADHLEVKNLNDEFKALSESIEQRLLTEAEIKARHKQEKKEQKQKEKAAKKGAPEKRPRTYVIDFDGDLRASAVEHLRQEISAVLQVASKTDEVLLRLESPGGMVHSYGLAASQLRRLRDAEINLTVAIDKVAASGGYLMACVADRIVAAPFAVIGSIGVVAQIPNFNRLLKSHNIDFEMHTAGEHKRTLTLFGENSDAAREKFREELEETHQLFKQYVKDNRPSLDIDSVATGEHWYGSRALSLGLIDAIQTSDDYLLDASKDRDLYALNYKIRQPITEKLAQRMESVRDSLPMARLWSETNRQTWEKT